MATGEYEDLVKAGVVDPTKVTRTALQNAASISALLLTTEALVTELPEKEKPAPGGMGGILKPPHSKLNSKPGPDVIH